MAEFNMKEKAKGLGSGILGILMFLGFMIVPFIFIFGILKVSEFLYPVISVLVGASIGLFLLIILPLSLFKNLQGHLAGLSLILSYVVGASVFMFSFLMIFYYLGWIAIFFMFMFNFVAPIAMIGLFFKGQWVAGFSLLLGIIFTYGMRFYGIWLVSRAEERMAYQYNRSEDVIDVDSDSEAVVDEPAQIEDQVEDIGEDSDGESDEEVRFDK